ncbi:MAG: hypothetical protein AAGD38_00615 [Acidobacteriota bacterium]
MLARRVALFAFLIAALAVMPANGQMTFGVQVFIDGYETGDTTEWSVTEPPDAGRPNCNCYFSSDCTAGNFCYWGPGGFTVEDNCTWRLPKPEGTPGAGCDQEYDGPWGPICDGVCTPSRNGSELGWEDPALVRQAVSLWGQAMVRPSLAGGGPIDEQIAAEIAAMPFVTPQSSHMIGRHVADLLILVNGYSFGHYFCDHEHHPTAPFHPYPNLTADACGAAASQLVVDALIAELATPDSGIGTLAALSGHCDDWQTRFAPRCTGEGAIDCLMKRISETAKFMKTAPPAASLVPSLATPLDQYRN